MFAPHYPTIHGYTFNIQHPYVFARGFSCSASAEFYEWIDQSWTEKVQTFVAEKSGLLECSPVLIAEFENVVDVSFKLLPLKLSNRSKVEAISITKGALDCWIHGGPANSKPFEERLKLNQF
eukprot:gene28138-37100_t